MGIGFILICDRNSAETVKAACAEMGEAVYEIGAVVCRQARSRQFPGK